MVCNFSNRYIMTFKSNANKLIHFCAFAMHCFSSSQKISNLMKFESNIVCYELHEKCGWLFFPRRNFYGKIKSDEYPNGWSERNEAIYVIVTPHFVRHFFHSHRHCYFNCCFFPLSHLFLCFWNTLKSTYPCNFVAYQSSWSCCCYHQLTNAIQLHLMPSPSLAMTQCIRFIYTYSHGKWQEHTKPKHLKIIRSPPF